MRKRGKKREKWGDCVRERERERERERKGRNCPSRRSGENEKGTTEAI